jgi:hypothetical protein
VSTVGYFRQTEVSYGCWDPRVQKYSLVGMTGLVVVVAVVVAVLRRKETPLELSAAVHSPRVGELRSYQGATYATVATAEP